MAQWCGKRREVHRYSLPCDGGAGAHSPPHSVTHPQDAGWQTILRVCSGPASPSGLRTAVTSVDVHVASGGGGALLAFARADGPVGVVDMRPDGDAPTLLWCRAVHKHAVGAPRFDPAAEYCVCLCACDNDCGGRFCVQRA